MTHSELEYLDILKRENKLTNQMIADMSAVPLGTVNRIMSGNVSDPSLSSVTAIVKSLGGSLDKMENIIPADAVDAQIIINDATDDSSGVYGDAEHLEKFIDRHYQIIISQTVNTYKTMLEECRGSYQRAYNHLLSTNSVKEHWVRAMFVYSAVITVLSAMLLIFK